MKSSSGYLVNSLTSQNTRMETSTEKQVPVSKRSCNLPSKAVKRVDKFQQTCQPETFSNLGLVSELNLIVTNDTSCQTDFQSEIGRPRYYEANHLISALNKNIQSLEKQLDEKQIIIEALLQTIHNCSYKNIVANSNHEADKDSFENFKSPHEKSKMISNKSNQVDENDNHNNNDNQKTIIETKDEQSMTLDKRNDKSSSTPAGDKIPEKETKEQIIESSHHHSDKKNDVTPTEKKIGRPRYYEANHLISALNKNIQSLEKQLDEKQIIIEALLQTIHNCSYKNIVANSNHEADKVSFENFKSPHEKSKMISNKSNQVDENDNHNNNDNQKTIIETKDEQSMTLDKRNDKSSSTPAGDKIPEKETKEQIIESSHHHSDKKNDVTPTEKKIGRPRYYEANHLISALNKNIQSLEKQLDEKQIIIEALLQTIHNCSYKNIVANSNHEADKVSFENFKSPHEKSKMISNKSNQVDENDNHNNNDNQKTIIETKDEQSMTLDKRNDKSSSTPAGDKIPEKETKEQIIESSHHHSDKKNDVTPTEKTKKKTVVIVGDSIVRNVPSRSLNQSLKEYFSVAKLGQMGQIGTHWDK